MGKARSRPHGTGIRDTWKLWRHCMCRHGWYPLIVAPFITAASVLDVYSSLDCKFIQVNVGFAPVNPEWTKPTIGAGFWTFQSDDELVLEFTNSTRMTAPSESLFTFPGCSQYTTEFKDSFIQGDRAWSAAAIMAYCSGVAGLTATATIWLMTLCPLPACFVWPGVLLPAVLIGFLAGGAKFFIFGSVLCGNKVWLRQGSNDREIAESCTLQQGAFLSMASICCFFICICLIFYNVPEKRNLDPDFGVDEIDSVDDVDDIDLEKSQFSSRMHTHDPNDPSMEMIPEGVAYAFTTAEKVGSKEFEERDNSIPQSMDQSIGSEDRDDNGGLEAVMTKIGTYLKENGSGIDFESTIPSIHQSRIYPNASSPERDVRRVKSYNKVLNADESNKSMVSYGSRKSKLRDRIGKTEATTSRDDDTNPANFDDEKIEKNNKDENQCDISAITIDNLNNTSLIGKEFEGFDTNNGSVSMKSLKSTRRTQSKKTDNYRVY